ncbi:hypothetical protein [Streptomyces sp. NPDC058457]|uniref:hypothetical protein n=1 Tax=Streptomyces sp. NPDC058457 TaxID=3346507 RepID=UPI003667EB31
MSVGPYRPQFLAEELKPHVQGRGDEQLLFTAPQGGPLRVSQLAHLLKIAAAQDQLPVVALVARLQ